MIGIDWGTTSFRAFRVTRDGEIRERRVQAFRAIDGRIVQSGLALLPGQDFERSLNAAHSAIHQGGAGLQEAGGNSQETIPGIAHRFFGRR